MDKLVPAAFGLRGALRYGLLERDGTMICGLDTQGVLMLEGREGNGDGEDHG